MFNLLRHGVCVPLRWTAAAALAAAVGGAGAAPVTYVETFDDGQNHSGWTWDRTPRGQVVASGGNPGGYFQSDLMAVPALFGSGAVFTGDFRARAVGSIGGDLATVQFATPGTVISVSLGHHNGQPNNPLAHTFASFVTTIAAPVNPDDGWVSFDVDIPYDATETPDGWTLGGVMPQLPPTVDWNTLITHVDEIVISWGDPSQPVLLFDVVRGADNLRITWNVPAPGGAAALGLAALPLARRRRRVRD